MIQVAVDNKLLRGNALSALNDCCLSDRGELLEKLTLEPVNNWTGFLVQFYSESVVISYPNRLTLKIFEEFAVQQGSFLIGVFICLCLDMFALVSNLRHMMFPQHEMYLSTTVKPYSLS